MTPSIENEILILTIVLSVQYVVFTESSEFISSTAGCSVKLKHILHVGNLTFNIASMKSIPLLFYYLYISLLIFDGIKFCIAIDIVKKNINKSLIETVIYRF